MTAGVRELVYFLSRFPTAKNTDGWYYDAVHDCWRTGNKVFINVRSEAQHSIQACLTAGLTAKQVNEFIERNLARGN